MIERNKVFNVLKRYRGNIPDEHYDLILDYIENLENTLVKIATTSFTAYSDRPYISEHDSGYCMGVTDGHRLAATWARGVLSDDLLS